MQMTFQIYHHADIVVCLSSGNWTGEGEFKMWFKKGGAIEFGQAMLRAGKLGMLTLSFCEV